MTPDPEHAKGAVWPPMTLRASLVTVLLAVVVYVLFIHHLDRRDLWSSHEARAAQDAQTMLDSADWVLPRLYDGRVEMQKPPLYYWLVAVVTQVRGGLVDAWSVRMPSAAAAALGMVVMAMIGWHRRRPIVGLLAGAFLGTMFHYTWLGRVGRTDMPLTLTTSLSLAGYYLAQSGSKAWLACIYVGMAFGMLLKGPLGIVLPALVILVHVIANGDLHRAWHGRSWLALASRLGVWWGLPVIAAMAWPWFWLANERTGGEFARSFFWKHNLERGFGGDPDLEANPDAIWFYLLRLVPDLFPWSLLLPFALAHAIRRGTLRDDPEARFGMVWFGTLLVFFSLMRFKRADYLLPAYPGAALFLAAWYARSFQGATERVRWWVVRGIAGTVLAVMVGWMAWVEVYAPSQEPCHELRTFAAEVRRHVPPPGQVLIFRAEGHLLGFHLGRPYERLIEWDNLDVWASQPSSVYVVMQEKNFKEWEQKLEAGRLTRLVSTSDLAGQTHAEPLVLCKTVVEQSKPETQAKTPPLKPEAQAKN